MKKPHINKKQTSQIRISDKDFHFSSLDEIDLEILSKKLNKDIEKTYRWDPGIVLKLKFTKEVYTSHQWLPIPSIESSVKYENNKPKYGIAHRWGYDDEPYNHSPVLIFNVYELS